MTALKKILVVDDDPVVRFSFDRVLTPKGYAVITATDGIDAMCKLAEERYDVVYTDIRMPGMSGLEVAKLLKETRPWLPVVIVTGYGSPENEEAAKEIGVAEFLRKPLLAEEIEESVERASVAKFIAAIQEGPAPAPGKLGALGAAKKIGLFFAAPFIALGYAVVGPFVGLGLLAWMGYKALRTRKPAN